MTERRLYLGIDAGGSKTEGLAHVVPTGERATVMGAASNLQREGVVGAGDVLASLIQEAERAFPDVPLRSLCAGVAGAGSEEDRKALTQELRRRLSDDAPARLTVVHDAAIALEGAFEGGSGVIVIVGTGSITFARATSGDVLRAGGWGYLIGDEGSGHSLGIHGIRAVAAAIDGGPPTRLQALLAERFGMTSRDDIVRHVYQNHWPVQRAAPLVVAAANDGDRPAREIIDTQTDALIRQVQWLAERCTDVTPRIALIGGLTHESYYKKALLRSMEARLPAWTLQRPLHTPVEGALRMALDKDDA